MGHSACQCWRIVEAVSNRSDELSQRLKVGGPHSAFSEEKLAIDVAQSCIRRCRLTIVVGQQNILDAEPLQRSHRSG